MGGRSEHVNRRDVLVWTREFSAESTASPERLFAILEDTDSWSEWNAGVERIEMDGLFTAGTTATMVLPDRTRLRFRLVWVERGRGFEDETEVPETGVLVRVRHLLQPQADGHTRISYTCVVDGPDEVSAEVGAAVSADFPDVIAALAARAESTR
jgi:uncharacterized protein YndB with AHSA1/START domain